MKMMNITKKTILSILLISGVLLLTCFFRRRKEALPALITPYPKLPRDCRQTSVSSGFLRNTFSLRARAAGLGLR